VSRSMTYIGPWQRGHCQVASWFEDDASGAAAAGEEENGRVGADGRVCGWPTSQSSECVGNLWVIHAAGSAAETPRERVS
jgi:hypothetical protein